MTLKWASLEKKTSRRSIDSPKARLVIIAADGGMVNYESDPQR
jgi:hypothetical protein